MRRIINLMLAGLCFTIVFISCTKEYSLENGVLIPGSGGGGSQSGTAVFTLTGAPGACATPAITGNYIVGAPLDISNTVILSVDVTTIGTYTISTGSANGMAFSGTGTFTITGTQVIVLNGSGTPAAAGTNTFSPGTNGCSFQITATSVVIPSAVATLDCTTATTAGVYTQFIALASSNTVTIPVTVTTAGAYSITTTATNGCTFSGSGNLSLGAQTVVLTGSGTPDNAGAVSFPVSFGASSCNFSITFIAGTAPVDFLKCSIDGGALTNFSASLSGSLTAGIFTASGQSATQDLQIGVVDANGGAIAVGTYHNASPSNTTLYCDDQLTNIGSATPIWSDLSPSSNIFTLNITSVTATVIKGTFSGNLVDIAGAGGTKVITNGSFSITY
ncbi:hypothetical protein BH11BAC4_BH11BAC4_08100 [soil metagenome]